MLHGLQTIKKTFSAIRDVSILSLGKPVIVQNAVEFILGAWLDLCQNPSVTTTFVLVLFTFKVLFHCLLNLKETQFELYRVV